MSLRKRTAICADCEGQGLQTDSDGGHWNLAVPDNELTEADLCPTCNGEGVIEEKILDGMSIRNVFGLDKSYS